MNSLMPGRFISAEQSPLLCCRRHSDNISSLPFTENITLSLISSFSGTGDYQRCSIADPHLFLLKSPAASIIKLFAEPQTAGIILEYTQKGVPCRCLSTLY